MLRAAATLEGDKDFADKAIEAAECLTFIKRGEVVSDTDWLTLDYEVHYLRWAANNTDERNVSFKSVVGRLRLFAERYGESPKKH